MLIQVGRSRRRRGRYSGYGENERPNRWQPYGNRPAARSGHGGSSSHATSRSYISCPAFRFFRPFASYHVFSFVSHGYPLPLSFSSPFSAFRSFSLFGSPSHGLDYIECQTPWRRFDWEDIVMRCTNLSPPPIPILGGHRCVRLLPLCVHVISCWSRSKGDKMACDNSSPSFP